MTIVHRAVTIYVYQPNSTAEFEDLYVVVNTARTLYGKPGCFPVMPGEDSRTFPSLEAAVAALADLVEAHGHTAETAPVFRLTPVALEVVAEVLEKELKARQKSEY